MAGLMSKSEGMVNELEGTMYIETVSTCKLGEPCADKSFIFKVPVVNLTLQT